MCNWRYGRAKEWEASGDSLPLQFEPGVLTTVKSPLCSDTTGQRHCYLTYQAAAEMEEESPVSKSRRVTGSYSPRPVMASKVRKEEIKPRSEGQCISCAYSFRQGACICHDISQWLSDSARGRPFAEDVGAGSQPAVSPVRLGGWGGCAVGDCCAPAVQTSGHYICRQQGPGAPSSRTAC